MVPTFESGYFSISVWSVLSALGRIPLVRINGTVNKEYVEPFAACIHVGFKHVVFQQGNRGPHSPKSVSSCLQSTDIAAMMCQPQSPDLNPIDNVWGLLKQKLKNDLRILPMLMHYLNYYRVSGAS